MYDEKCHDLAEWFLPDDKKELAELLCDNDGAEILLGFTDGSYVDFVKTHRDKLAQEIQDVIEGYISYTVLEKIKETPVKPPAPDVLANRAGRGARWFNKQS